MNDRPLPNLLLAGVAKSGTTSLFWYLAQHPDICASKVKELHYFTPLRDPNATLPSLDEYASHFQHCAAARYRMEGSPSYAFGGPAIISAIERTLDNPKIIISLRDPVQRMWSAYAFNKARGKITDVRSCDEFVTICEWKRRHESHMRVGDQKAGALSAGFYDEYLDAWLTTFGSDLLVVFAEDLFRDPAGVVGDVCRWLDIDADAVANLDVAPRNKTVEARNERLRAIAYSLKDHSNRVLEGAPAVRSVLRTIYGWMNTTVIDEEFRPETRERLELIYAESKRRTGELLCRHGYTDMPSWARGDGDD